MTRKLVQTWGRGSVKVRVSHCTQVSDSSSNSKQYSSSGVRCRLPFSRPCHMYTLTHFLHKVCAQWDSGRRDQKQGGKKLKHLLVLETRQPRLLLLQMLLVSGCQLCVCSHSVSLRLCTQTEFTVAGVTSPHFAYMGSLGIKCALGSCFYLFFFGMDGGELCAKRVLCPKSSTA